MAAKTKRSHDGKVSGKRRKRFAPKDSNNERGRIAGRYRGYPTADELKTMRQYVGSCRSVQNLAKEQREMAWRLGGHRVSYTAQTTDLKELRDDPEIAPWLSNVPSQILQQALKDTDTAFQRFFARDARYPHWKRKGDTESFRDPQGVKVQRVSRRRGRVWLQGVGWIRVRMHRPPVGSRVCSATWTIEPDGKVFVSVLFEIHKRQPAQPRQHWLETAIGVDRGVEVAAATSDGEQIDRDMWTPKEKERLRRLERQRERQKTARRKEKRQQKSNKQVKTERAIAALHGRARRRRRDFVEQVSCDLAKNHGLVVFENLHVKSITAAAKGTKEEPGTNVRQKAGLNRAILNKAWGVLKTRTEQKALRHGHLVVVVPARNTSITCPNRECGHVDPANRATRSVFICKACGHQGHADITAAQEILERGIILMLSEPGTLLLSERGILVPAGGTPVAARPGTNREPNPAASAAGSGAKPSALAGLGSGNNQETGYINAEAA